VDDGAHLTELDEELRRVGWDDEDVGVGLDEDAGFLLVGLTEVFARGDGFVDLVIEGEGLSDASAVATDTAVSGKRLTVGPKVAGLTLALNGHGEHESESVFAGSGGAGEYKRVREAAGRNGGAEVLDGRGVSDEVDEAGGGGYGLRCYVGHVSPPLLFAQNLLFKDFNLVPLATKAESKLVLPLFPF
jgi:hypothetical protein